MEKKLIVDSCMEHGLQNEPIKNYYLTELYHEKEIFIDKCGGHFKDGLHHAGKLFTGDLSFNLKRWNLITAQPKTEKEQVKIFEVCNHGDFHEIFKSLNTDLEKLCFTQEQIKQFCLHNQSKLHTLDRCVFFLFKEGENFFLADVRCSVLNRLVLYVHDLSSIYYLDASWQQHFIVVPAAAL